MRWEPRIHRPCCSLDTATQAPLENPQHTFSSAASSGQSPVPFRAVLLAVEGVGLQAGKPRKGAAKGARTQAV